MEDTRKKELFPFFAYLYSQQLDPDKYGQVSSMDEWIKTIQSSEEDIAKITQAAEELSDEDWDGIDQQYSEQVQDQSTQFAAKGAKLKKLKTTPKKCKCGCDMVTVKEKGGKISSKCSCNCKGGSIKKGRAGLVAPKLNTTQLAAPKPAIAGSVNRPVVSIMDDTDMTFARHENAQVAQANKQIRETFSQRFARERASGAKEFTWYRPNGTPYQVAVTLANSVKPVTTPQTKQSGNLPNLNNKPIFPKTFPGVQPAKPFSLLRKDGGILTKQAGGPVKPTTPVKAKVTPNVTPKPSETVDNSPERKTAQKYKSEFYSKKGIKYDTESGLPIAPMKAKGGLVKKQSGGDISQSIGTTQKGGKVKDRIGKSKAVVIPASLKCGGKGKIKPKTKK